MGHKKKSIVLRNIPVDLKSIIKIPITITPNSNILDARTKLLRYRIGRLIVEFNNKPVGIITEKDIARSISIYRKKSIEKITVSDIMSKNLIVLSPTATIYDCAQQMKTHSISSIIIQDNDKNLIGIITKTDLVSTFLIQSTASLNVSKIMTKKVITASPNDSIFEVQSLLFNNKIHRLVVTKNNIPTGIITYRDFIPAKTFDFHNHFTDETERNSDLSSSKLSDFNVNDLSYLLTFSAKDIMTKNPFVVYSNDDVYTAAILMIRHGISGLPVIRMKKMVGIVTKSDIVNILAMKGKI